MRLRIYTEGEELEWRVDVPEDVARSLIQLVELTPITPVPSAPSAQQRPVLRLVRAP
ncbi:hypothetical protein [Streptomyces sp. KL116D]|uniref:hypothetical protein n=1 Tax=Streptomyces sp. KL116D TaxID=3045152 RepID=UPI0035563138